MAHEAGENAYFGIFLMLLLATLIFSGLVFAAGRIGNALAAKNRQKLSLASYECGPIPIRQANKISSQFFIIALIFILLDIEVVFLFPWALVFRSLGWFGLVEIFIFLILLMLGLLYAYKKGALSWQSIR